MKYFYDFIHESVIQFPTDEFTPLYSDELKTSGQIKNVQMLNHEDIVNKIYDSFIEQTGQLLQKNCQTEQEEISVQTLFTKLPTGEYPINVVTFWDLIQYHSDNNIFARFGYLGKLQSHYDTIRIMLLRHSTEIANMIKKEKKAEQSAINAQYSSKLINFANSKGVSPDTVLFANHLIADHVEETSKIPQKFIPLIQKIYVTPKLLPKKLYRGGRVFNVNPDIVNHPQNLLDKIIKEQNKESNYSSWTSDINVAYQFANRFNKSSDTIVKYLMSVDVNQTTLPFIVADLRHLTTLVYYGEQEILIENGIFPFTEFVSIDLQDVVNRSQDFVGTLILFFFDDTAVKLPANTLSQLSNLLNKPYGQAKNEFDIENFVYADLSQLNPNIPLFVTLFILKLAQNQAQFDNPQSFQYVNNKLTWNTSMLDRGKLLEDIYDVVHDTNNQFIPSFEFKNISLNYNLIEIKFPKTHKQKLKNAIAELNKLQSKRVHIKIIFE